jgi:hypothetical protein
VPDQSGKIIAEYVWIGGSGADLRSKVRRGGMRSAFMAGAASASNAGL